MLKVQELCEENELWRSITDLFDVRFSPVQLP